MPIYPPVCLYTEFSNGQACGMQLLKPHHVNGVTIQVPIKHFVVFSFEDWLVGLLSRSGFEKMMDEAWQKCNNQSSTGKMEDIFEGEIIRNFQDPDGKHFGLHGDEG